MPNLVNKLVKKDLTREFKDAEGMLLVTFGGLTVQESETLRTKLSEHGVKLSMIRNKLARQVLSERGCEFADGTFVGNTAIAYGGAEAAIHAAKIFTEKDVKKAGKVSLRAGLLSGSVLGAKDAEELADVPDMNTLRSKILGCLSGPARGLVTCLDGNTSGFARLMKARSEQLEGSQPG